MHKTGYSTFSTVKQVVGKTRNPKPETRKKAEIRNPKTAIAPPVTMPLLDIQPSTQPNGFNRWRAARAILPSDFGPRISDFLRFSAFGFRIS